MAELKALVLTIIFLFQLLLSCSLSSHVVEDIEDIGKLAQPDLPKLETRKLLIEVSLHDYNPPGANDKHEIKKPGNG